MDANIATPAALIGDPARAAMLQALLDGRSMPASSLTSIISAPPESRLVMRWTTLVIAMPDYASRPTRTSTAGGQRT